MKPIIELYHFEKFWKVYTNQDRCISKWDEGRTDMDVFINRTIQKWFVGKFFQVEIENHAKMENSWYKTVTQYKVFTKYVYITNIKFAFAAYHDKIRINFIEAHSEKIGEVSFGWNDFMNIKLMENEGDFRLLRKFYPITIKKYDVPKLPLTS